MTRAATTSDRRLGASCDPGARAAVLRVCRALGARFEDVRAPSSNPWSRNPSAVNARKAAALALRRRGCSLQEVGRALGGRDHSTITREIETALVLERTAPRFARAVSDGVETPCRGSAHPCRPPCPCCEARESDGHCWEATCVDTREHARCRCDCPACTASSASANAPARPRS